MPSNRGAVRISALAHPQITLRNFVSDFESALVGDFGAATGGGLLPEGIAGRDDSLAAHSVRGEGVCGEKSEEKSLSLLQQLVIIFVVLTFRCRSGGGCSSSSSNRGGAAESRKRRWEFVAADSVPINSRAGFGVLLPLGRCLEGHVDNVWHRSRSCEGCGAGGGNATSRSVNSDTTNGSRFVVIIFVIRGISNDEDVGGVNAATVVDFLSGRRSGRRRWGMG